MFEWLGWWIVYVFGDLCEGVMVYVVFMSIWSGFVWIEVCEVLYYLFLMLDLGGDDEF